MRFICVLLIISDPVPSNTSFSNVSYHLFLITQGIGLIPYFAVVGITAAAGGGAVAFNTRRRPDSNR